MSKGSNVENTKKEFKGLSSFNINHISPSHLSSKASAELLFQDTIGSALNHIQNLENIQSFSQRHYFSTKSDSRMKENSHVNTFDKKPVTDLCKKDISNFNLKFQKLEKDMQESISRLENKTRIQEKSLKLLNERSKK